MKQPSTARAKSPNDKLWVKAERQRKAKADEPFEPYRSLLEKEIEKKGNEYAESKGWVQFKFVSPATRGVPDRIYFRDGRTLLVEWKRNGEVPTKLQAKQIKKIQDQGIEVHVVDNCNPVTLMFVFD
jgi:hypothetical protein